MKTKVPAERVGPTLAKRITKPTLRDRVTLSGEINLLTKISSVRSEPEFLVDSGATHRLTQHHSLLKNVVELDDPTAFGLAGATITMSIHEKGDIELRFASGQVILHILRPDGPTKHSVGWTPMSLATEAGMYI